MRDLCPEVAWIVSEFEDSIRVEGDKDSLPKHHEDNDIFQTNSSNDVKDVYHAIPGNTFEAEALCAIHNLKPFPPAAAVNLREVIVKGEEQVQNFLSDRLILQKVPITAKIPKNNFSSIKGGDSGIENQVNFGVSFMSKLRSAVEHSNDQAKELFEGELYDVPPCCSINCTDQMYQGYMILF